MENNHSYHSHSGLATWWSQRISAIALIPLVLYFAYFIFSAIEQNNIELAVLMFDSPFITLFLTLFLSVGIYHGNIGIKEIIEDYIHSHTMKISLILVVNFISISSAIAGVCAIFVMHLSTFNFS
jgi:succinate dehydrogenase / fumarate reductase membrane anchor subunit